MNLKKKETLETASQNALKQIKENKYSIEFIERRIRNIQELGIAFEGKNVMVKKAE